MGERGTKPKKFEELDNALKGFWARNAHAYSEASISNIGKDSPVTRCIHSLYPGMKGLRILDVGTGAGCTAITLALKGHRLTGIDICEEMIDESRINAEKFGVDVKFIVCSICDNDLPSEEFDVVVFQDSMFTISDSYSALSEANRLLCPGGHLIISTGNYFFVSDEYDRRKSFFKYKYGVYELQRILFLDDEEYKAFEQLAGDIKYNGARHPGWEVWVLSYLGYRSAGIKYEDDGSFKALTRVGMSSIPLYYTIYGTKSFIRDNSKSNPDLVSNPDYYHKLPGWYPILDAICNRERVMMLRALDVCPRPVHELSELLGTAQNLTSHHLRILKEAGLVSGIRSGRETIYSITKPWLIRQLDEILHQINDSDGVVNTYPQIPQVD